jgi:hypothetical protein
VTAQYAISAGRREQAQVLAVESTGELSSGYSGMLTYGEIREEYESFRNRQDITWPDGKGAKQLQVIVFTGAETVHLQYY